MKNVIAALRAVGILVGTWSLLGLVAWAGGVIPEPTAEATNSGGETADAADETGTEDTTDGANDTGTDGDGTATTAGGEGGEPTVTADTTPAGEPTSDGDGAPAPDTDTTPTEPVAAPAPALRADVCDAADRPSVSIDGVRVVVGCGDHFDLLTLWSAGERAPDLVRIARFTRTAQQQNARSLAQASLVTDVGGDGAADLVLGFVDVTGADDAPSPTGGTLYYVSSAPGGGFKAPLELAPILAPSGVDHGLTLAAGALNGQDGADLAALHVPDTRGRRDPEAWLFAGGSAPARSARLQAGARAAAIAVADLDRDENADVLIAGAPGDVATLRVHFGDGEGRARSADGEASVVVEGAASVAELLVVDVDHDGGSDAVIVGEGLAVVRAGRADALSASAIEAAPRDMRSVGAVDMDGDGKVDLIGISGDGVVWLRHIEGLSFEAHRLPDLPLEVGAPRGVWARRDGDTVRVWLLTRRAGDSPGWSLLTWTGEAPGTFAAPRTPPAGPLSLDFALR